jgi:hypothetical protein
MRRFVVKIKVVVAKDTTNPIFFGKWSSWMPVEVRLK